MRNHKRLYELDALRGIAAVSVFLFHFSIFKYGCVGVDLFFIISGFVIFMSISKAKSLNEFWLLRFIRLYPSYWLSISIIVISSFMFNKPLIHITLKNIIGNITMFQPVFRSEYLSDVYWTLYVEMLFYITIAIIWHYDQLKNIESIILIGLIIIMIINLSYLIIDQSHPQFIRCYIITRSLLPLLNHFQFFSAGILFYLNYKNGINRKRLILLILTVLATAIAHKNSVMINSFLTIPEHIISDFVIYVFFFLIVQNRVGFLRLNILLWFGEISYPLYLVHSSFGLSLREYLIRHIDLFFATIIAVLCTIGLSSIITFYYDLIVRRLLLKAFFNFRRKY